MEPLSESPSGQRAPEGQRLAGRLGHDAAIVVEHHQQHLRHLRGPAEQPMWGMAGPLISMDSGLRRNDVQQR